MRTNSWVSLSWVAGAFLAVAMPETRSAAAVSNSGNAKLLSSDLPAGVTLKAASVPQVGDALYTAATQRPDMVMGLFEVAVVSKRPSPKDGFLPCPDLVLLLRKAMAAVPDKGRQLVELAIALEPGCADPLNQQLDQAYEDSLNGFGAGLGTNFPGSPGFTGSPPGGATALPPSVVPPTTNVTGG